MSEPRLCGDAAAERCLLPARRDRTASSGTTNSENKPRHRERNPHDRERNPHTLPLQIPGGQGRADRLLSLFKDSVQALSKEINKATWFKSFRNNSLFHFPSSLCGPGPGFCLFCAASLMVPDWSVSDFIPMGDVKS